MTTIPLLWPLTPEATGRRSSSDGAAPVPDAPVHYLVLGTTCKGKSVLLQELAHLEPSPQATAATAQRRTDRRDREQKRLLSVAKAYWLATTGTPEDDLSVIFDALALWVLNREPTLAECEALFLMLPATVIGQGIAWGFDDTEVRGSVHEFVQQHCNDVEQALKGL